MIKAEEEERYKKEEAEEAAINCFAIELSEC